MVDDRIYYNVYVWSILLSIVFVTDFLDSGGVLGLCIAMLDPITFKVILVLTNICVVGFLVKTLWYLAENLAHRRHKGFKWRHVLSAYWEADHGADHGAAPFRFRPLRWIPALPTSVQSNIANIIGGVKRFLHSDPRALLPTAHNNNWNTVRTWAGGSQLVEIGRYDFWVQAIRYGETRVMDYPPMVIQAEEKKGAAHFWKCSHSAEGLRLKVIKTKAHVRAIR